MRVVIEALIGAMPAVFNILTIVLGLMTVFAIVGMRLFLGSFASCSDTSITTRAAYVAADHILHLHLPEATDHMLHLHDATAHKLPALTTAPVHHLTTWRVHTACCYRCVGFEIASGDLASGGGERLPREWRNPWVGHFDSYGASMMTLFQVRISPYLDRSRRISSDLPIRPPPFFAHLLAHR